MAIALTDTDLYDLMVCAHEQGEPIYHPTELGYQLNMPQQIGQGDSRTLQLRGGLTIDIRNVQLQQSLAIQRQHEDTFPITAKFYLSGRSRVRTPHVPEIESDYEEIAGCNYLYWLPDLTETEEWQSGDLTHVIIIHANVDYFRALDPIEGQLPRSLHHLMKDRTRFHQSLGKMTPAMTQVLQQMLCCPYHGSAQHLYLESKALELLALQLASLEEKPTLERNILNADDLERIQFAKDVLVKHLCAPPSLRELSRQVGLNERKLKQGFRQLFGTTVFGYLRDRRMERARQLLCYSEVTIARVATQVGYRNPEAFSTAFRRQFAVSPKAYQLRQRR